MSRRVHFSPATSEVRQLWQSQRRMNPMADVCRRITVGVSVTLGLLAMGMTIWALYLSSWQVVNLREYGSIHEHGLWLDCTRHSKDGTPILERYHTENEALHCVYKWDYDKYSGTFDIGNENSPVGEVNRHKFYGWQTFTFVVLLIVILITILSVAIAACSCNYGNLSLVYTGLTLLSTFLASVAVGVFFFYSHRADNRFIKLIVSTYEQRVGMAFFLQLGACLVYCLSFVAAILFTYLSMAGKSYEDEEFSLQQSSRTNVTNIGRSMDFDPMMYPPATPASNVRPYSKHEEYERHVAESMPEIHRSVYPGEIMSSRIRRKSETCV